MNPGELVGYTPEYLVMFPDTKLPAVAVVLAVSDGGHAALVRWLAGAREGEVRSVLAVHLQPLRATE